MATTYVVKTAADADVRAAAGVNDALLAIGRVIVAIIFIQSGLEKFMDPGDTAQALAGKGFPMPEAFAMATVALELGGGLLILLGWQTRIAALVLAVFTMVAAYFFHDFWNQPPGMEHTNNMINFMKNLTIFGGFLMLCAAGAGRYSLDGPCIRPELLRR